MKRSIVIINNPRSFESNLVWLKDVFERGLIPGYQVYEIDPVTGKESILLLGSKDETE